MWHQVVSIVPVPECIHRFACSAENCDEDDTIDYCKCNSCPASIKQTLVATAFDYAAIEEENTNFA